MKRIVFYGDSNTYGYDPRGFYDMRYPKEVRWTEKVRDRFRADHIIIEEGQNGRQLPSMPQEEGFIRRLTGDLSEGDLFFIMLGTNDILLTDHPDAERAVGKMQALLEWLKKEPRSYQVIVIGPVPISATLPELRVYHEESLKMNEGFAKICEEMQISYYDSAEWGISMAYDGVHFSEEGCAAFAGHMAEIIEKS